MLSLIFKNHHLKVKKTFPNAKNHSLASGFFNPNFLEVQDEIFKFTEITLNIKPKINE